MRIAYLALMASLAVALTANSAPTDDKPKDPPKSKEPLKTAQAKLMAEKLKAAQLVLDGLATNDFDKINKNAQDLLRISKTAEFLASKSRDYELHTNSFRRALETILTKSNEKNIDGATLGYVDMTLTCIRCHQHTRETRNASLPSDKVRTALAGLGR